jgi:hypothetical protein
MARRFSGPLLAAAALIAAQLCGGVMAQPLGVNPSAAPSDLGNPSSINPSARPSDIWNPSAINPSAAASQIPRGGSAIPVAPSVAPRPLRQPMLPPTSLPSVQPPPSRRELTARQMEERRRHEASPGWLQRAEVGEWQELRAHLATCWSVPPGTDGSSVTLRFMISSAGELRGPPMITATNVLPKELATAYRDSARAVLEKCLPVRPTAEFGAVLHDTVLHLRLVNDAPFASRNIGQWMTIFARSRRAR